MARACRAPCVPPGVRRGCRRVPPGGASPACQDASRDRLQGRRLVWEALPWHPGQCRARAQGRVQADRAGAQACDGAAPGPDPGVPVREAGRGSQGSECRLTQVYSSEGERRAGEVTLPDSE